MFTDKVNTESFGLGKRVTLIKRVLLMREFEETLEVSSTFYEGIFCTKAAFLPKSFRQIQNVTREKLLNLLSYENVDEIDGRKGK